MRGVNGFAVEAVFELSRTFFACGTKNAVGQAIYANTKEAQVTAGFTSFVKAAGTHFFPFGFAIFRFCPVFTVVFTPTSFWVQFSETIFCYIAACRVRSCAGFHTQEITHGAVVTAGNQTAAKTDRQVGQSTHQRLHQVASPQEVFPFPGFLGAFLHHVPPPGGNAFVVQGMGNLRTAARRAKSTAAKPAAAHAARTDGVKHSVGQSLQGVGFAHGVTRSARLRRAALPEIGTGRAVRRAKGLQRHRFNALARAAGRILPRRRFEVCTAETADTAAAAAQVQRSGTQFINFSRGALESRTRSRGRIRTRRSGRGGIPVVIQTVLHAPVHYFTVICGRFFIAAPAFNQVKRITPGILRDLPGRILHAGVKTEAFGIKNSILRTRGNQHPSVFNVSAVFIQERKHQQSGRRGHEKGSVTLGTLKNSLFRFAVGADFGRNTFREGIKSRLAVFNLIAERERILLILSHNSLH